MCLCWSCVCIIYTGEKAATAFFYGAIVIWGKEDQQREKIFFAIFAPLLVSSVCQSSPLVGPTQNKDTRGLLAGKVSYKTRPQTDFTFFAEAYLVNIFSPHNEKSFWKVGKHTTTADSKRADLSLPRGVATLRYILSLSLGAALGVSAVRV